MRATEFITETAQVKGTTIGDVLLRYATSDNALAIRAYTKDKNPIGFVKFYKENDNDLDPQHLWVNDDYRSKGVAKAMYDYLKSEGYRIVRSWNQTDAGKGFWDKHRGEEVRVWEDEVEEACVSAAGGQGRWMGNEPYRHLVEKDSNNTISLWHGGRGLENSFREIMPANKGRWELGPGLYLTNSLNRAHQYARGSNKVYKVVINRGRDIAGVQLPFEDVVNFVNGNIMTKYRASLLSDIQRNMERMNSSTVSAKVFLNLIINSQAVRPAQSVNLIKFLIAHGIDYSIDRFGGFENEMVVVVFNPNIIVSVTPVKSKEIGTTDYEISPIDK